MEQEADSVAPWHSSASMIAPDLPSRERGRAIAITDHTPQLPPVLIFVLKSAPQLKRSVIEERKQTTGRLLTQPGLTPASGRMRFRCIDVFYVIFAPALRADSVARLCVRSRPIA